MSVKYQVTPYLAESQEGSLAPHVRLDLIECDDPLIENSAEYLLAEDFEIQIEEKPGMWEMLHDMAWKNQSHPIVLDYQYKVRYEKPIIREGEEIGSVKFTIKVDKVTDMVDWSDMANEFIEQFLTEGDRDAQKTDEYTTTNSEETARRQRKEVL